MGGDYYAYEKERSRKIVRHVILFINFGRNW